MFDWIRNPFECLLTDLNGREQEELAELPSDRTLRLQFNTKPLLSFWIACSQVYPLLSEKAVNLLLPFATTYLCESAFSAVTAIKTKIQIKNKHQGWCSPMFVAHITKFGQTLQRKTGTPFTLKQRPLFILINVFSDITICVGLFWLSFAYLLHGWIVLNDSSGLHK